MDVIHQKEDGLWYFWDETWAFEEGPFGTRDGAEAALDKYWDEYLIDADMVADKAVTVKEAPSKEIEWLTEEEIIERATTPEGALAVSIEHYEQMLRVTEQELREAFFRERTGISSTFCGLCKHHLGPGTCLLRRNCESCCCMVWIQLASIHSKWNLGSMTWFEFREALRAMLDKLKGLQ